MSNDKVAAAFHGAGPVVDLVGALRASVDRARQNRGRLHFAIGTEQVAS